MQIHVVLTNSGAPMYRSEAIRPGWQCQNGLTSLLSCLIVSACLCLDAPARDKLQLCVVGKFLKSASCVICTSFIILKVSLMKQTLEISENSQSVQLGAIIQALTPQSLLDKEAAIS